MIERRRPTLIDAPGTDAIAVIDLRGHQIG
jgi:hypothetical protein